jgi:hypothetical protein
MFLVVREAEPRELGQDDLERSTGSADPRFARLAKPGKTRAVLFVMRNRLLADLTEAICPLGESARRYPTASRVMLIETGELTSLGMPCGPLLPAGNRRDVSAHLADLAGTPVSERVWLGIQQLTEPRLSTYALLVRRSQDNHLHRSRL